MAPCTLLAATTSWGRPPLPNEAHAVSVGAVLRLAGSLEQHTGLLRPHMQAVSLPCPHHQVQARAAHADLIARRRRLIHADNAQLTQCLGDDLVAAKVEV